MYFQTKITDQGTFLILELNYLNINDEYKEIEAEAKTFRELMNALKAELKGLFLIRLEKWVQHKRFIIEKSQIASHKMIKISNLEKANKFLDWAWEFNLESICKVFLLKGKIFREILPHSNNVSYQSSLEKLEDFNAFCKQCLDVINHNTLNQTEHGSHAKAS